MDDRRICAVVVSYMPTQKDTENLAHIRAQVGALVVVDNGSPSATIEKLRTLCETLECTLIENGENLGIATALNKGVAWADVHGYEWVISFDQDSTPTPGMIETMMTCVEQESGVKTGIFVPRYQDSRSGHILPALYDKSGNLTFAMSSGSLVRTETFRREGGYVDELFVGGVDFDFSLRLRSRGYLIRECTQALLLHEPSYPRNLTLFGVKILTTSNYSAMRRYYSERNRVWLRRMYMKDFPSLCLNLYWTSAKEYVKVLVGEKEKGRKLRLMLLGVLDGLAGKMGRTTRA